MVRQQTRLVKLTAMLSAAEFCGRCSKRKTKNGGKTVYLISTCSPKIYLLQGYHSPDRKNPQLFQATLQAAICQTNAHLLIQILREQHVQKMITVRTKCRWVILLSCHNQISLTTPIPWPFPWLFPDFGPLPNFGPFPWPQPNSLTFPGFRKFQKVVTPVPIRVENRRRRRTTHVLEVSLRRFSTDRHGCVFGETADTRWHRQRRSFHSVART